MDGPGSQQGDGANGRSKLSHVVSSFYGVYVLQSVPKPRSFYIGSTPDPIRRLKQHNGEIKTGGAYRTKRTGLRPWKVVLIVYNFPSNVSALQFEHSLQHPYQTRHIPSQQRVTTRKGATSLPQIVANVKLLMTSPFFASVSLKVLLCDGDVADKVWPSPKYNLPSVQHLETTVCSLHEFFESVWSKDDFDFDKCKTRFLEETQTCSICNTGLDYSPEEVPLFSNRAEIEHYRSQGHLRLVSQCHHNDCDNCFHLTCMARSVGGDSSDCLIPRHISCTSCDRQLDWLVTVKIATRLREYILKAK